MADIPESPSAGAAGTTPSPPAPGDDASPPAPSPNGAAFSAGAGPFTTRAGADKDADDDYRGLFAPPAERPDMTTGGVLSQTWRVMNQNFALYIGLALIPMIPSLYGDITNDLVHRRVMTLLTSFFTTILQAAAAYAVYRTMSGETATIGEALSKSMKRFFPLLGASIAIGIATTIGFILFVLPGLIFTCVYFVAIPACVVEHKGPLDSLQRSANLTAHYRWTVFFLLVAVFIITFAVALVMKPHRGVYFPSNGTIFMNLLYHLSLLFPKAFQSVMTAVVYFTLRGVKEGTSVEHLATV
ncbi:MAG: hypothetical protein LIP18_01465, partial [Planctomycetes bacterium]|nr:hypothetical protein [Planctomycetota bacterium]